jgi:hypothetical protein
MLTLMFAILLLIPTVAFSATLFIDGTLNSNCTSRNYSIAHRACNGSDGNAYNDIQSAICGIRANDTISFRSGTYVSNST